MQRTTNKFAPHRERPGKAHRRWTRGALGLAVLTAFLAAAQPPQQSPSPNPDRPYLIPEANRLPDKNQQMQMHDDQAKKQNVDAANSERKRQISDDTAKLLELATQLKAEVDKTSKDTLSINVIRKAESIEKLARGVKDKMKLTMGAS
ncbi:hypothetical protein DYQ86_21650 [Acidobacteria bacterium AB60]|nr:hypothetical protein DYQ86_21650 [Acidobacteria bacterium AB60]